MYPWNFDNDIITTNLTLYAIWTIPNQTFIVTFDSGAGSKINPQTIVLVVGLQIPNLMLDGFLQKTKYIVIQHCTLNIVINFIIKI